MRKVFIPFVILCVIVTCLAACTAGNTGDLEPGTETPSAPTTVVNTTPNDTPHEPPLALRFGSFEGIAALRGMIDQSDDVVEAYLTAEGFDMNGQLSSKEDVVALFQKIDNLKMLHLDSLSGYTMTEIEYYISYGYVMSTYRNESDMIRFICYINDENLSADSISADKKEPAAAVVGKLTVSNKSIPLYKVDDSASPYAVSGRWDTSNSRITLLLSNRTSKGADYKTIEQNIVESTLRELTEQKR